MNKKWIAHDRDYFLLNDIQDYFGISELVARVLVNREIDTHERIERFLNTNMDHLHDPYLLKGMKQAVDRIALAVRNRENICIYGDYDVDGITSTSVLVKLIKRLNGNVTYYIPNRMEEGYGLSQAAVEKLIGSGIDLIVTVDCGIRSIEVIQYAREHLVDVVVTDHHECEGPLPNANCIVNPLQYGCGYPFKELAGVGVAFKLGCALAEHFNCNTFVDDVLDIVAVGTIADVVALVDENRIIVKNGLEYISNTQNVGLKALLEVSGIKDKSINAYHIAFMLAPRINAAGRIADASLCVELLLTDSPERAVEIAKKLDGDNRERQAIENEILNTALDKISAIDLDHEKVIVLDGEDWHAGVIGIVASKIVDRYHLPTVMISREGELSKGSARSIPRFNIYEAMSRCGELFEKFGGHELAAGFTLKSERIPALRERLGEEARSIFGDQPVMPEIMVDYRLTPKDISFDTIKQLKLLEPFGIGNPCPLFVYRGLKLLTAKTVGFDHKHLAVSVFDGINEIKCIGYNLGRLYPMLAACKKIDVICSIETNVWNNKESIQLNIKDIKTSRN